MSLILIRQRLAEVYAPTATPNLQTVANELISTLDTDGNWPDLVSKTHPDQIGQRRAGHFSRIQRLVHAFYFESDARRCVILSEAIHRALGVWLSEDVPAFPNWQKQIGVPKSVARIAILFESELSDLERKQILAILQACVRPDGVLDYADEPATGANLADEVELQVVAGILLNDEKYIERYVRDLERAIQPGTFESIQVDWSFHQHGIMLYSGGYGVGFIADSARKAWVLRDTPLAFKPETIDILTSYLLKGLGRMTRGRSFDYTTVGRQIARPNLGGPTGATARAAEHMANVDVKHRGELLLLAKQLRGQEAPATAPVSHQVFWKSDYVTHLRPGFFASARMSSRRVQGTESGNGENEQGYHLGDGAMSLMVTGDEYTNIFPLWNWRRVPGVSCIDNPSLPFPRHMWGKGSLGFSDFVGGVSDGESGVAAMELHRGGLYGKKAWFFLEESVVCLGTGLLPDDSTQSVVTGIEQCWARGPIYSSQSDTAIKTGETHLQGAGWVHHDGVSYLFPYAGNVRVLNEHKSAKWSAISTKINRTTNAGGIETNSVEGDVFTLWLEHGKNIARAVNYAYIIAPHLSPSQIPDFQKNKAPKILVNQPQLQAVSTSELVQAVFWRAGTLNLVDGRRIETNSPCLLQWKKLAGDRFTLAVSDPTQLLRKLRVTVYAQAGSSKPIVFDLKLPEGQYAGESVVRTVKVN